MSAPASSMVCAPLALICLGLLPAAETPLAVFQDLVEATARIERIAGKPHQRLFREGFVQSEVLIFHDLETGKEVWSLSREAGTDIANIERRCAWSCDGRYISFLGNSPFWHLVRNELNQRPWAGHNYLARADGGQRRKLWAMHEGTPRLLNDKFNNWDRKRPGVLYYPDGDKLWRVVVGVGERDNQAEPIFTFPNPQRRTIQEISDQNLMLIEEAGASPNCYVINLAKEPSDPLFCLTHPLKGEVHPGSFRFRRSQPLITGGYEQKDLGAIRLLVDAERGTFTANEAVPDPHQREMWHLWYGPPDDRVAFSGKVPDLGQGLFVHVPGSTPVLLATVSDGHPSWCGFDPEWFFYAVGEPDTDSPYSRRLVAGRADGSQILPICTPFDRRRGGKRGYDAIPRPNQSPDATKCWFHSSMLSASDAHTGSFIAVFRRPHPPLSVSVAAAQITWQPHALAHEVRGYRVYRSTDQGTTWGEISPEPIAGTTFTDPKPARGPALYAVSAEEWSGLESDRATVSASAPMASISAWDQTPPNAVTDFRVAVDDGIPRLTWTPSTSSDVRHYHLYASTSGRPDVAQRCRIVSPRHDETTYLDWTAAPGTTPIYALTAVDRQGNESEPVFSER